MAASSRGKREEEEEQAGDRVQLGSDFANAGCMMNAEVLHFFRVMEPQWARQGRELKGDAKKTETYVARVQQYNDANDTATKLVRKKLDTLALNDFEIAQLGNLAPETVAEAKELIPSLKAYAIDDYPTLDAELGQALKEISKYKSEQYA